MSALSDKITRYIPIARKKPKIDKREALAIIPVRNPLVKWERKGEEIILTIPLRDDKIARLIKKYMKNVPDFRQMGLDDVGSTVWELCDGVRDINGVVETISKDYKLTRREAEASVTMFMQTLAKKHLIGLMTAGGKKSASKRRS